MARSITFIGKVHSSLKNIEDCPLQENENAPEAEISILPEFIEGIRNIRKDQVIVVLTWLHMADRKVIETKPRNNSVAPLTGVFSTRSPDRPNPIGIHLVKVLSIAANGSIKVSRLEVIDQTPVIDIKPAWNENAF